MGNFPGDQNIVFDCMVRYKSALLFRDGRWKNIFETIDKNSRYNLVDSTIHADWPIVHESCWFRDFRNKNCV